MDKSLWIGVTALLLVVFLWLKHIKRKRAERYKAQQNAKPTEAIKAEKHTHTHSGKPELKQPLPAKPTTDVQAYKAAENRRTPDSSSDDGLSILNPLHPLSPLHLDSSEPASGNHTKHRHQVDDSDHTDRVSTYTSDSGGGYSDSSSSNDSGSSSSSD